MHDVLRLFGQRVGSDAEAQRTAVHRLAAHYADRTTAAVRRIYPDMCMLSCEGSEFTTEEATAWLAAERQNVIATAAAVTDDGLVVRLADALRAFQQVRQHGMDWTLIADRALRAAWSVPERAAMSVAAAMAYWGIGRPDLTAYHLVEAVDLYRRLGRPRDQAMALHLLGCVEHPLGWLDSALQHCREALRTRRISR
jgi:hypothetical protein